MPIVKPLYIDVTTASAATRTQKVTHLAASDEMDVSTANVGGRATIKIATKTGSIPASKLKAAGTNVLFGRYTAGAGAAEEVACTAAGRALLDDADAAAQRATLSVPPASRAVQTGQGLSGGGDLTSDRTVVISSFTGLLAKDHDPGSATYTKGVITTLKSYTVGGQGHVILTGVRLPPRGNASLKTRLLINFHDGSVAVLSNGSDEALTDNMQGLAQFLMGDVTQDLAATNDGKRVVAVAFEVENTDVQNDVVADLAAFRVRAFVVPAGGGSVTVS